jgi:hypothetical protein
VILTQDKASGYWIHVLDNPTLVLKAHNPWDCDGALCDVHDRRGEEPWASWPLNWREDYGFMEVVCPHGVGHPTPAQAAFWRRVLPKRYDDLMLHGCDDCCARAYHQIED